MPSPPVQIFLTTIASQPALRQRQEYLLRILQVKKIDFTSYDVASDEDAKRLWKRKAPLDKQQLPGILVGGTCPGTFAEFEEAVEFEELSTFLRLNETYDPEIDGDGRPAPSEKAVGVPGASTPQKMTNQKPSFAAKPSPLKSQTDGVEKGNEIDLGAALDDAGLQGVTVSDQELADLVKELGLEGDDAGELVKGLSASAGKIEETHESADVKDISKDVVGTSEKDNEETAKGEDKLGREMN